MRRVRSYKTTVSIYVEIGPWLLIILTRADMKVCSTFEDRHVHTCFLSFPDLLAVSVGLIYPPSLEGGDSDILIDGRSLD